MNTLGFVTIIVMIWLLVAGVTVSVLFGATRYAMRRAHAVWRLPPKVWLVLVVGEITQAIGILFFLLAGLADGLMLQLPLEWMLRPLVVLGFLSIYLGSIALVIWLYLAIRTRGRASLLDALFGRDRRRTVLALVLAVLVASMLGNATMNFFMQSWLVGCAVAVPIVVNLVCLYSLLAHTATAPDPDRTVW